MKRRRSRGVGIVCGASCGFRLLGFGFVITSVLLYEVSLYEMVMCYNFQYTLLSHYQLQHT